MSNFIKPFKFGLIGKRLQHSFSKNLFETEWRKNKIYDKSYDLLEFDDISELQQFLALNKEKYLGLNVTIPYKIVVCDYVKEFSTEALSIGAINCLKFNGLNWIGHNTDGPAFLSTIIDIKNKIKKSLILGNGGASKAVQWALRQLILDFDIVSRKGVLNYDNLEENWNSDWNFIIQTSPVGMYPNVDRCLAIPFKKFNSDMIAYDLIYNPAETVFLKESKKSGTMTINGIKMLEQQARLSDHFWTAKNN